MTLWTMKPTIRKRAERQLAERERGADREPLAEVVQPDPDRDERRQRDPSERALRSRCPRAENRCETNVSAR